MSGIMLKQNPAGFANMQECIMANSADLDLFDPVKIDSNGFLAACAAGDKVQGWFAEASKSVASDNQTVAQTKGRYIPVRDDQVIELTADQACTQTDLGAYADFVVSAGDFKANLAAGSTGQLEIIDFDPNRDGTTTLVRAVVAEPQALAFAQS